jgi:hypothetical protein
VSVPEGVSGLQGKVRGFGADGYGHIGCEPELRV